MESGNNEPEIIYWGKFPAWIVLVNKQILTSCAEKIVWSPVLRKSMFMKKEYRYICA